MLSTKPFVCPPSLLDRATAHPAVPTAVVGADEPLALESVRRANEAHLIAPVLVGSTDKIHAAAKQIGWSVTGLRIEPANGEVDAARRGVALARNQEVSALMKGHVHTDALMRAVLDRELGLRSGRRVSHAVHMSVPDRDGSLVITDAAVNVEPTADTMLDMIHNVVFMMHALGNNQPRIAVLSATEQETEAVPSSQKAAEVCRRAQHEELGGALVAGPLALDNAISPQAASLKGIDNPVAGAAEVLVVPNIETGNTLFKAMVFMMSATAGGLVLGARVPIMLTSRADPPEARLASAALANIVAAHQAGT